MFALYLSKQDSTFQTPPISSRMLITQGENEGVLLNNCRPWLLQCKKVKVASVTFGLYK